MGSVLVASRSAAAAFIAGLGLASAGGPWLTTSFDQDRRAGLNA